MEIKVYEGPRDKGQPPLYLHLKQNGPAVTLEVLDSKGDFVSNILVISDEGIYRCLGVTKKTRLPLNIDSRVEFTS